MRHSVLIVLLTVLSISFGCGESDEATPCDVDGEVACQGALIRVCLDGFFSDPEPCPISGDMCMLMSEEVMCMSHCTEDGATQCVGEQIRTCQDGMFHEPVDCDEGTTCQVTEDIAVCQ